MAGKVDGSIVIDTKIASDGIKKGMNTLKGALNSISNTAGKMGKSITNAFNTSSFDSASGKVRKIGDEIDRVKDAMYRMEKRGLYFGDREYDDAYRELTQLNAELVRYKKELSGTDSAQKKASKSTKKLGKDMDKASKSGKKFGGTLSMIKMSVLYSLVFRTISAIGKALTEGYQNLAQYSSSFNDTASQLKSSLTQLKNSFITAFAPILTVAIPILSKLIGYLSQALTVVGKFIAALTGQKTFTQAKKVQEDYAKSLGKTGKAADKASKSLAVFDNLNILSSGKDDSGADTGVSPADMFEEVPIDNKILEFTDKLKEKLSIFADFMKKTFGPALSEAWGKIAPELLEFKAIMEGVFEDLMTLVDPFLNYLNSYFIPFLQQVISTAGEIISGLLDSFNMVFSDIWNTVMFPFLQTMITVVLPMLTEFGTEIVKTIETLFNDVKRIFDTVWQDAIQPALALFMKIWKELMETIKEFWDKWGKPIFDALREAITNTADTLLNIWNTIIKPVFDKLMKTIDDIWTNHLKPLLANFLDFVGELIVFALMIYNKVILPLVNWFVNLFGGSVDSVIGKIINRFGDFLKNTLTIANGVISVLRGIIQFLSGDFSGGWSRIWNGIKDIFGGIWNNMVGIVKTPVNLIISIINGMISGIVAGVNAVIQAINTLKIDIPGWIPGFGGRSIGFSIPRVSTPRIPHLATGTVVPKNAGEFAAILGDNKREPEIVSPLSTMKQALKEAMAEMGSGGSQSINLNVYLDGKQIHREVVKANNNVTRRTGANPLLGY